MQKYTFVYCAEDEGKREFIYARAHAENTRDTLKYGGISDKMQWIAMHKVIDCQRSHWRLPWAFSVQTARIWYQSGTQHCYIKCRSRNLVPFVKSGSSERKGEIWTKERWSRLSLGGKLSDRSTRSLLLRIMDRVSCKNQQDRYASYIRGAVGVIVSTATQCEISDKV